MPLRTDRTTFTELLLAAGYHTALIGKCHLQNMMGEGPIQVRSAQNSAHVPAPDGLTEAVKEQVGEGPYDQELEHRWVGDRNHEITLPYYGFEHVDLCINHGDLTHGHYGRWLDTKHPNSNSLRGPENALPSNAVAPEAWRTKMPVELYPTTYVANQTIAYLEKYTRRNEGPPFFLQCSFPDPHHPFTPPGEYFDLYKPEDVELPPSWNQSLYDAPPQVRHEREKLERGARDIEVGFAYAVTEDEARQAMALTYGMIALIDDMIGRILTTLDRLGLSDNTIIVFTSDHGDFMGDHHLLLKGPVHYQGLTKVPFIWADPTDSGGGRVCDRLASGIDFAPTVLDRAGLQIFYGIQGKSLLPLISGGTAPLHEALLIEEENQRPLFGFDGPPRINTLQTEDWRLSIYDQIAWGEFYDLRSDPHEMNNLWDSPDHACDKMAMLEGLARKFLELRDRAPFPTMRA
jgi:arylsulfatase A-like enzyme